MNGKLIVAGIALAAIGGVDRAEAQPAISIDPNPVGFSGGGMIGTGGAPGEVQWGYAVISNAGTTALTVTGLAITGPDAGLLSFEDASCPRGTGCPGTFTLAPGEGRSFSVTCVTTQPGTFSAQLTVTSDAASGTSSVPITCKGLYPPELQVQPSALDFGTAHSCWYGDSCGPACNTRPLTQTLTITNTAPAPSEADISLLLPPSGPAEDFTIEGDYGWPASLAAGQSIQLTLTFHPRFGNTQFYDAPLRVTSSYPADVAPIDIPFHAHGGDGWLVVDTPPQLGVVPIGETLTTTITVHNAGSSCLHLSEIHGTRDLTVLEPTEPTLLLQSGESFSWSVACTPDPQTPGGEMFFWTIYEAADTSRTFPFSCHSDAGFLRAEPAEVVFTEAVEVGRSATQRVNLANIGFQPTDLTAMSSSDARFTAALASGSLPAALGSGDQTAIDVTFTPTEAGHVAGTIALEAASGNGVTLSVMGDGVARPDEPPPPPPPPERDNGCTAGGSGSTLLVALGGALLRRRRRSGP